MDHLSHELLRMIAGYCSLKDLRCLGLASRGLFLAIFPVNGIFSYEASQALACKSENLTIRNEFFSYLSIGLPLIRAFTAVVAHLSIPHVRLTSWIDVTHLSSPHTRMEIQTLTLTDAIGDHYVDLEKVLLDHQDLQGIRFNYYRVRYTSLSYLARFRYLTHLSFGVMFNDEISALGATGALPRLTHLSFGTAFDQPVTALGRLLTLQELSFGTNFRHSITPLAACKELTRIRFGLYFGKAVTALQKLPNLTHLILGIGFQEPLTNGDPVETLFPSLRVLVLSDTYHHTSLHALKQTHPILMHISG